MFGNDLRVHLNPFGANVEIAETCYVVYLVCSEAALWGSHLYSWDSLFWFLETLSGVLHVTFWIF